MSGDESLRSAALFGRDHVDIGAVASVSEGGAGIAISRGGASKTYSYVEPNEDAAAFAEGAGGLVVVVADGHYGCQGSEAAVHVLLERWVPSWTAETPPTDDADGWQDVVIDALLEVNHEILRSASLREMPPAPTTLSLAIVRPGENRLVAACVGDSHLFVVRQGTADDRGWASTGRERTHFLGREEESRTSLLERSVLQVTNLSDAPAVVLVTDGISEEGIGLAEPGEAVAQAVAGASAYASDRRSLECSKGVVAAALGAHRRQRAGDNVAVAVVLSGV